MSFASNKNAYGICDISGFRYRLREMRKEWTGLKVGPDEYEEKHPQLTPSKQGADPQTLFEPRPDQRTEVAVAIILQKNPFKSGNSDSLLGAIYLFEKQNEEKLKSMSLEAIKVSEKFKYSNIAKEHIDFLFN